jgi:hypothetical protein
MMLMMMMMMRNATHSHARLFAPRMCVFFFNIWIRHLAGQKIFFKTFAHKEYNKIQEEEEDLKSSFILCKIFTLRSFSTSQIIRT